MSTFEFVASCFDGEVRLVEGESEWEGRLEVCFSRRWGTVSSDGWTQTNTQVFCLDMSLTQVHYSWLHLAMPAHYRQHK